MGDNGRPAPLCSVVIPTFNNCFFTRLCLEGLRKTRAVEPPYELIIVDNGSTDDTGAILAQFGGDISRIIKNSRNLGFAAASNQGAALARGSYLVFVNNDLVVEPGWLKALVAMAQTDATIGAVGARLLYPDGCVQHAGVVFGADRHPTNALAGYPPNSPEVLLTRDYQAVTGACLLVDRELFSRVGGFDETYHNSFEDVDLCFKIRRAGRRVVYCPGAVAYHFESASPGRLLRDDPNIDLFLGRWANEVVADYDPSRQRYPAALGIAQLMHREFERLVFRARSLAAENLYLRGLLSNPYLTAIGSSPVQTAIDLIGHRFDLVYRPGRLPRAVAGAKVEVPIIVENAGAASWKPSDLALSYHWRQVGEHDYLVWEGQLTTVEEAVEPNKPVSLTATVVLPDSPGSYVLEWDAIDRGAGWLSFFGVTPFQQVIVVQATGCRSATVEGLPAIADTGETIEVGVSFETGVVKSLSTESLFGWRWVAPNGIPDRVSRCETSFVCSGVDGANGPMRVRVATPDRAGRYHLQLGQWLSQGSEWVPIETLGGVVYVKADDGVEGGTAFRTDEDKPDQTLASDGVLSSEDATDWQQVADEARYHMLRVQQQVNQERQNVAKLVDLVEGYRAGRVMRLMDFLQRLKLRATRR